MIRPTQRLALLLLLLLSSVLSFTLCASDTPDTPASASASSSRSGFHTAQLSPSIAGSSSSSPPTPPPSSSAPLQPPPSRIVYEDEDRQAAQMAWLHGRMEEARAGGAFRYVDSRLVHPSSNYKPKQEAAGGDKKAFVFSAQREPKEKEVKVNVPVEKVGGALTDEEEKRRARVRSTALIGSPPVGRRGRRRFNEAPLRRPLDDEVAASAGGGSGRGMRANSPTKLKLDEVNARLASLQLDQGKHRKQREAEIQRSAGGKSSASTPHELSSNARERSSAPPPPGDFAPRSRTPPAGFTGFATAPRPPSDFSPRPPAAGRNRYSSLPASPPPAPPNSEPLDVRPPYRMWSARSALPTINIPASHITNPSPADLKHYQRTLRALSSHDWSEQLTNRVLWAARARSDHARPARIITPLGAVTGSDISTHAVEFVANPTDPMPRLDSVEVTDLQKKIGAWLKLAHTIPGSLTAKSRGVYASHSQAGYAGVDGAIHDAVHPIQYVRQLLMDPRTAVVLENSIHGELERGLQVNPPDLSALAKKAEVAGKKRTAAEMMGTTHAPYNLFWPSFHQGKAPMKVKNAAEVGLDRFGAFAPWADAVALRPV